MNFNNSFSDYTKNAYTQKIVASKLISFAISSKYNIGQRKYYDTLFEIGCGTGILTREIQDNINYNKLILNDIFLEAKKEINNFLTPDGSNFICGDIEKLPVPKADLIISSSVFQWIKDKENLFKKISNATNSFIFSIYTKGNLQEIKDHFNISLEYNTSQEIYKVLSPLFTNIYFHEEEITVNFDTPLEALKHLKNTGVTGIGRSNYRTIKSYKEKKLTYKVAYFICNK